jgi:quinoprotein glucose dehydrogenase
VDGRGAQVGPDLARIGKTSAIEQIIESIVAPDAMLAQGFETNIITTTDGTPHLGFVIADDEDIITIKDSGGQTHKIEKNEVVSRKPQTFSLMPPFGELLTPQQIADLAAFLKARQK